VRGVGELGDSVARVASMEIGPGRLISMPVELTPPLVSTPASVSRAVCQPIDPESVPPVPVDPEKPLGQRAVAVMQRIWDDVLERGPGDVVRVLALNVKYQATLLEIATDLDEAGKYATAAGLAYSDYVREYFEGYLDLVVGAFHAVKELGECNMALAGVTASTILARGDVDLDELATQLTAECGFLLPVIRAAALMQNFYATLARDPLLMLGAALEVVAETAVLLVEKFADSDLIGLLEKYVDDVEAIGQVHGTIIGIVIAEIVIDELLTLGAGKVVRGMRTVRRLTP
jgi:hypothetical protein